MFDIAFIGHYTKDTIVYPTSSRTVDGGAYYFGASVTAQMGMSVAVVTRLAQEDWGAIEKLRKLGVTVMAHPTPSSTLLKLIYPIANLDERTIELTAWAGPFEMEDVNQVQAQIYTIAASSVRGEIPLELVAMLAGRGAVIALDVQGFIRVLKDGKLGFDNWPGKEDFLKYVTVLKTDAVEAELLTGEKDRRAAAQILATFGPQEVLVTNSSGVLLYHDGEFAEAPFVPRQLKGRSGRGDTCTGAYLSRRMIWSPREALFWAAAMTSLKLEEEGPFHRPIKEVEELYKKLKLQAQTDL